ncbi:MAG: hypothetical protein IH944_12625 [Armatimonadetes bacterium]|nr:hypothetical protein [Armatimonadota bacterium]
MKHLRAYRNTESFRSAISALAVLLLVAGCSSPSQQVSDQPEAQARPPIDPSISYDEEVVDGDLALIQGDARLSVGDSRSQALRVFKAPAGSYPRTSLPSGLGKKFSAIGWESNDASFGAILYTRNDAAASHVVQAMVTWEGVDEETVQQKFLLYRDEFGLPSTPIGGQDVAYWFWQKRERVLMINKATDPAGKVSLTVAVGLKEVMAGLRMSESAAKKDKNTAEELLRSAKSTGQ